MSASLDLQALLALSSTPIAIGFFDTPPPGVPQWSGGAVAAGCVFWKRAQEGQQFYTVPADHYNCAIGAYTHRIPLPVERAEELGQTLNFMVSSRYLAMEEVPGIPTLESSPAVVAYSPLDQARFTPDLVVLTAQPARAMLIYEAAIKAGAGSILMHALGRPACAVLPLALNAGTAQISLGCKGNRTFTGLPDSEMYLCIPGARWEAVVQQVHEALAANQAMGAYYRAKQTEFEA